MPNLDKILSYQIKMIAELVSKLMGTSDEAQQSKTVAALEDSLKGLNAVLANGNQARLDTIINETNFLTSHSHELEQISSYLNEATNQHDKIKSSLHQISIAITQLSPNISQRYLSQTDSSPQHTSSTKAKS